MTEEASKKFPKSKMFLGVAAVGAIFVIYNGFQGQDSAVIPSTATTPAALEHGSDPVNSIGVQDRDAALTQFAKKIESLENKLTISKTEKANESKSLARQLREQEQRTNTEIRALSEELARIRQERVDGAYSSVNAADTGTGSSLPDLPAMPSPDGGLNFDDLSFDFPAPPSQQSMQANPYGPNYFILRPDEPAAAVGTINSGGSLSATEAQMFEAMGEAPPQQQQYGATRVAQYGITSGEAAAAPVEVKPETLTVPAFSFVEVTTLHGVACPVGANSPGASSASNIPARPVVIPVRGVFRGPNGAMHDLGNVHLMGLCSGIRTSSGSHGRATVRVEQMSYWDAAGGARMAGTTGYIVDTRDNEQGVYGRLDKASGRTLALQSMAAAAAAFSSTLSQAEFSNQTSVTPDGTTSNNSVLTGNATQAGVQQGVAALFTKIGQRFEQEANAAIDTVVVEPGIKLRFVTDQPITVELPADPFEVDPARYDILI
ncbi:conjugal transfer protein TraB (plasmid) [Halopseudomonas sp. SMJS2]|uniref:conjugal transfer protein TraB n=1 Tax=Halopseudomonas sp. SMJS2 TaxID=3041098 RepID=UPI0024530951|nr:conjugal transfer protein TraB [Halopseudomonas sp. SMJS2]WGK63523.1 conjugal transfer protein TraB [Halopseudomonas sp. SMJS2]